MNTTKDIIKQFREKKLQFFDDCRQVAGYHEEQMYRYLEEAEEAYDEVEKCEDALNALE